MSFIDEVMNRQKLDRRDAQFLEIADARLVGKAGIGAPEFFRNHGIADAEAFDVDLVDDGIGQRRLGLAIVAPIEIALDDDAFRHAGGAVLDVHLEIVAGSEIVGEDGLLPTDMAGDGPA